MEVVQAEGGVLPAPVDFVRGVRRVTRELDIPLIVDEIQSGCGRTGSWFAFEQYGIVPDAILASKALGGIGMPIAVVMYDERLDVWAPAPTRAPSAATTSRSRRESRRRGSSSATGCSGT